MSAVSARAGHLLLILGAVAALYGGTLRYPFIFDDDGAIARNPSIRELGRLDQVLSPPFGTTVSARPVLNLTFALNHAIGGLDPSGYRLVNVMIHAGAALLLYGIVRRTLAMPPLARRFAPDASRLAFMAALLWAIHPVQTESVTYVVQRAESLAGFFYLLTLYALVRVAQGQAGAARAWPWEALAAVSCALGMGTKEVLATAPLVLSVYDRIFLADSWREVFARRARLHAMFAACLMIPAALAFGSSHAEVSRGLLRVVTPFQYAATQTGAIVHYLRLCLLPAGQCLDYVWPIALRWETWLPTALFVAGLLAGIAALARRVPAAGFLGLWFFAILAPTSSVIPLADVAFEHRLYLPSAAVVVAAVLAGHAAIGQRGAGRPALWAAGTAVACLFSLTAARNRHYASDAAAWREVIRDIPANPRARNNLGNAFYQGGRSDTALPQFDRAVTLRPDYADAHFNRGVSLARVGRTDEADAAYRKVTDLDPRHVRAHMNLGALRIVGGRPGEALAPLESAREVAPASADVHSNLGVAYLMLGRLDESEAALDRAVELDPRHADALSNRAILLRARGRLKEAAGDLARVLAISPSHAGAQCTVGEMLLAAGHPGEAIRHFERALAAEPGHAGATRGLSSARALLAEPK